MRKDAAVMRCEVGEKDYWNYALFDAFRRRRLWRSPAVFAFAFCVFAAVCFIFRARARGSVLLGCVLLCVGLGLPAFFIGNYLLTLRGQVKKLFASGKKMIFTVCLDRDGVTMKREGREQSWPWRELQYVYRLPGLICVYPTPGQAFLMAGDEGQAGAAWRLLQSALPPEKVFDLVKRGGV